MLKAHEERLGYQVMEIEKQEVDTIVVSSTKIRTALQNGDVKQAAEWLGHPFVLSGQVVHGQHLGRKMGYPTANIHIPQKHKLIPPEGIYAVRVHYEQQRFDGMLYIGRRPTLEGISQSIEVNIFDFNENIYQKNLTIAFIERIRDDIKFKDLESLTVQLGKDKEDAVQILEALKSE